MAEAIRSLIIEPDPDVARQVYILGRQTGAVDIRWKSDSVAEGVEIVRKFRPDMAIVGINGDPGQLQDLPTWRNRETQTRWQGKCRQNSEN